MSTAAATAAPATAERTTQLRRRVRLIVGITITWNVLEAVIAISAGNAASSAALIGFGLDSVVEVLSAAAVAWQFASPDPQRRERVALRVIAVSFFGLAAYVGVDATLSLTGLREAEHSPVGIALAALSLLVMPFLSWWERRTGRELGSASAVADAKQTLLCTYLSAALLGGLLLNALLGWAWADAVAALVIAGLAVREGVNAWRGELCCPAPVGAAAEAVEDSRTALEVRAARDVCGGGCCAPSQREPQSDGDGDGTGLLVAEIRDSEGDRIARRNR
ncbi:cation transporter [Mycetocola reblochoni]|uniref:Cobalt transporter n=2 Tax=Mycetocola reblochoni TaxID=331618 RepID=A0A3L6ZPN4_9MICO|nr:cation transporter [Mycetocola reblochoni]RLP69876.1 cobalt transporter [Mycetocola reblochoni]SJN39118.1 putative integral membrane protein [Mycetocola reblochoni REB411]